jgi:cobalt transporter subunit CbtA
MTVGIPLPFHVIDRSVTAMIARVLTAALLAGFVAGMVVSLAQAWQTEPLITSAELFEAVGVEHGRAIDHNTEAWTPADGAQRRFGTLATNVLTGVGFALVLAAAITLSGRSVTAREGVLWGLAGFASFAVAPALGMPPALPGMETASLEDRQLWWVGATITTAGGLWLMLLVKVRSANLLGVLLLALPHLVGAPVLGVNQGDALPPQLAAEFAVATLFVAALFWTALGATLGRLLGTRDGF